MLYQEKKRYPNEKVNNNVKRAWGWTFLLRPNHFKGFRRHKRDKQRT